MSSRRERPKRTRPRNEPYKRQGFNENKYKRVSLEQVRKSEEEKIVEETENNNESSSTEEKLNETV